jgi:hypothetical protein
VSTHLESVSNGLGAPSLWLLLMAIRKEIPATVSITADTGAENDRLWNTGRRSTNQEYFDEIIVPLCKGTHVTPYFVRSVDENKAELLPLMDEVALNALDGRATFIPLFGSKGGRQMQSCTDKFKIRAIRQQQRRLGAKTGRTAQGIHFHEASRRVKGIYMGTYMTTTGESDLSAGPWHVYRTTLMRKKKEVPVKWQAHYYPLVDLKMSRQQVYDAVNKEGIPFIISSECDLCPHKDLARWERSSESTIADGERIETLLKGKYFFTDRRIPLRQAIAAMQAERAANPERYKQESDFGCRNDLCGV